MSSPDHKPRFTLSPTRHDTTLPEDIVEDLINLRKAVVVLADSLAHIMRRLKLDREAAFVTDVREAVAEIVEPMLTTHHLFHSIMGQVSKLTGVSERDILGQNKTPRIAFARKMVCYIAVDRYRMKPSDLAPLIGRDRSTIMSNVESIKASVVALRMNDLMQSVGVPERSGVD